MSHRRVGVTVWAPEPGPSRAWGIHSTARLAADMWVSRAKPAAMEVSLWRQEWFFVAGVPFRLPLLSSVASDLTPHGRHLLQRA